jgi:beta-glucosidase
MRKHSWIPLLLLLLLFAFQGCNNSKEPQLGKASLRDVVAAMTFDEKIALVNGTDTVIVQGAAGTTFEIKRLGIPSTVFADGPQGVNITVAPTSSSGKTGVQGPIGISSDPASARSDNLPRYATAFPSGSALAATWNVELVERVGKALGNEALEFNIDVLLAPGMNIQRNPRCGRNFEYYSEDPLVSGKMAASVVKGIQSNGIGASLKCLAAYNQETNRKSIDCLISQRALREIYLRGFEIAVKESHPWTIMSAYNKINGCYAAENGELLTTILRDEWGFKGIVMTDWGNLGDPVAKMNAGNDLLMPGSKGEKGALLRALKYKSLDEKVLDTNVSRILEMITKTPKFKKYRGSNQPDGVAHAALAREAATEGIVLLKNYNGALPFSGVKTIALYGKTSYDFIAIGAGSANVNYKHAVPINEGLRNAGFQTLKSLEEMYSHFMDTVRNSYNRKIGDKYHWEHIARLDTAIAHSNESPRQNMEEVDLANLYAMEVRRFDPNKRIALPIHPECPVDKSIIEKEVLNSDIAVITMGRITSEGTDNNFFPVSEVENKLIREVSEVYHAAGKKVVVILNVAGVMDISSWSEYPDAILHVWQTGQQGGDAVADLLKGEVNPSGKLPVTFPVRYTDDPSSKTYPGYFSLNAFYARLNTTIPTLYNEGIYVGYRYYSTFKVPVACEFGFGLSYTTFEYTDINLSSTTFSDRMKITVKVKNSGKVAGREVVQLYLSAPKTEIEKPVQELKGFAKTKLLQPGESISLSFELDPRSLSSFWSGRSEWVADKGIYEVLIGASSKDIRQKAQFNLPKEIIAEEVHQVLYPYSLMNFVLDELSTDKELKN